MKDDKYTKTKTTIRKIKNGIIVTVVLGTLAATTILSWYAYRTWNYKVGYQSMVEDTVCSMVKPEYLKKPC
jgi:hypothetical protein